MSRIWDLRDNLTVHGAAYVALAEALDASLLTADRKLAPGVRGALHGRRGAVTAANRVARRRAGWPAN